MAKNVYIGVGSKAKPLFGARVGAETFTDAMPIKRIYLGVNNKAKLIWEYSSPYRAWCNVTFKYVWTAGAYTSGTMNYTVKVTWHVLRPEDELFKGYSIYYGSPIIKLMLNNNGVIETVEKQRQVWSYSTGTHERHTGSSFESAVSTTYSYSYPGDSRNFTNPLLQYQLLYKQYDPFTDKTTTVSTPLKSFTSASGKTESTAVLTYKVWYSEMAWPK